MNSRVELQYEGRRAMFVVEEHIGRAKGDEFLREAEQRRLVRAYTDEQRRARRERLRRRFQRILAMLGQL